MGWFKIWKLCTTDAYGTLESNKSVCQGYAELTDAFLKSVGIPSRLVTVYALGLAHQESTRMI